MAGGMCRKEAQAASPHPPGYPRESGRRRPGSRCEMCTAVCQRRGVFLGRCELGRGKGGGTAGSPGTIILTTFNLILLSHRLGRGTRLVSSLDPELPDRSYSYTHFLDLGD